MRRKKRSRGLNRIVFSSLFFFFSNTYASDVPQSFTLDGQLFSDASATAPLLDSSITMDIQILDEDKVCILYEETQTLNTLASQGYFTAQVGTATGSLKRPVTDPGNSMATVFQNITGVSGHLLSNGGPCTTAPGAGKRRFVRITISPVSMGSVARVLSPDLTIDSVPNAIVAERAESLQGLRSTDVLKVNTASGAALTQTNLESLFTSSTRFNSLTSIVDGTSTNYMRSNSNSGAQLPVLPGAPTTPTIGAVWFDASDSKIKFQTSVGPATLGTGSGSVTSVGFTAPPELSVAGAPVTSAGTIAVTWAVQLTNKVLAAPDGSTGTPTFRVLTANDIPNLPWTKITSLLPTTLLGYGITDAVKNAGGTPSLESGLDAGKGAASTAGRIWIATDTKLIYRDNGATWDQIAAAGSPTGAAGGDLAGTYPNPTVAKIQGVAVSATTPLDGQVLKYATSATSWAPSNFNIGDLKTSAGAQQFAGSATCAASQTLTWSSLTDTFVCTNIAGLDGAAITAGTVAAARLPASASAWTVAGSDVYRSSGNVGIGTSSPAASLDIAGQAATSGNAVNAINATGGAGAASNGNGGGFSFTGGVSSGSGTGGGFSVTAGNGSAVGYGGAITLTGGKENGSAETSAVLSIAGGSGGTGSPIGLSAGTGGANFNGGALNFTAGQGGANGHAGGQVNITGGAGGGANASSAGGDIVINGGAKASTAVDGNVLLASQRGNVGIGTTTPNTKLTVSANAGALQPPAANSVLHVAGADGTGNRSLFDGYGVAPTILMRTSSGTAATPTAVTSGDNLGMLAWAGFGTSTYSTASAKIVANAAENWTNSAQGTYFQFMTTPTGATSTAEAVRITAGGNVGIGTTNPTQLLHVNGPMRITASALPGTPATGDMAVDSGDANKFKVYDGSTWQVIGASGGAATSVSAGNGTAGAPSVSFSGDPDTGLFSGGVNTIGVSAGGSTIFNFTSAGLVSPTTGGANVTTANGSAAAPTYSFAGDTGTGWFRAAASTLAASTGGTERIRIDSSGNVGIGTTTPGYKLDVTGGFFHAGVNSQTIPPGDNSNGGLIVGWNRLSGGGQAEVNLYNAYETSSTAGLAFLFSQKTGAGSVTDLVSIGKNGNVGIGTTSPTSVLHLVGSTPAAGSAANIITAVGGTGAANGAGGAFSFTGGTGNGTGSGGAIAAVAGGGGVNGTGGAISITGGVGGTTSGQSGGVTIAGGNGPAQSGGGAVTLLGGTFSTYGASSISLSGSGSLTTGSIALATASGNGVVGNAGNINTTLGSGAFGGTGGAFSVTAGSGQGVGTGGAITMTAGAGGATNVNGANIVLNGGAKGGTGTDGNVILANTRGSVGIGTASPLGNLHVKSSGGNTVTFDAVATSTYSVLDFSKGGTAWGTVGIYGSDPNFYVNSRQVSSKLVLAAGNGVAPHLTIDTAGNVGIGTTSPAAKLDVTDAGTTTSAIIVPRAGNFTGTSVNGMVRYNSTSTLFEFYQNGAWVNYTTVSDGRLKTNIVPVTEGLDIVNQLNPVFYDWDRSNPKASSFEDKHQVGFIAQEVEKVLPEVVNKGEDSYRSLEYGKIVSVVVAGVKELYAKVLGQDAKLEAQAREIASVKAENAAKEKEIAELKARLDRIEKTLESK